MALLIPVGGIAVLLALGWGLVVAGLRAGDQAGDAMVSAVVGAGQLAVVVARRVPPSGPSPGPSLPANRRRRSDRGPPAGVPDTRRQ